MKHCQVAAVTSYGSGWRNVVMEVIITNSTQMTHSCQRELVHIYPFQSLISDVQTCIQSLVGWMYSNKLKLNATKTDACTSGLSSVGRDGAAIGGKCIPLKFSARNLGVHLDQTLSMQPHISNACCTAYLELRTIATVRPYLAQSATAQLVLSA